MAEYRRAFQDRSKVWDITMVTLLAGSVAIVFWYASIEEATNPALRRVIEWVDLGLVVFFILEWVWRVRRSGPDAPRYALKQSWELLGMIPILLPLPAFLRALRLVRLVRILRVFKVIGNRLGLWQRIASAGHLDKIGLAGGSVTFVGAFLVWLLEKDAPGARLVNFGDSLWWAIVTVTTVGYGDITPVTPEGRFVASLLMITGIGIIGLLASTLANALLREEPPGTTPTPVPHRTSDFAVRAALGGELEKLADLRARGLLDDAEFVQAKALLLGTREAPRRSGSAAEDAGKGGPSSPGHEPF